MSTTAEDRAAQLIYGPNVLANSAINTTKFISACFAGAAAGILGLENWAGFFLFLVATLLSAGIIYSVNCKGRPAKYFQGGVMELVNPGQDNAFTFVLVWTLFYGIVHGELPTLCLWRKLLFDFCGLWVLDLPNGVPEGIMRQVFSLLWNGSHQVLYHPPVVFMLDGVIIRVLTCAYETDIGAR